MAKNYFIVFLLTQVSHFFSKKCFFWPILAILKMQTTDITGLTFLACARSYYWNILNLTAVYPF